MSWKNSKIIGANQKRGEAGQERGHREFVMSRSQLVEFAKCPAKWRDGVAVEEESKAMKFGSVLDCLVTSADELEQRFAITPDLYPATPKRKGDEPEMKKWTRLAHYCDEWEAEKRAQGFTVVSPDMMQDVIAARESLFSEPCVADLLDCSQKQVLITAEWHEKDTGLIVPFSALLDLVPDATDPAWGKVLGDIKTARSGDPANWPRVCDDSGYDVQAAIYFDLYQAAMPHEDRTGFVHLVVENTHPFHVTTPLIHLSTEFLEWGRAKYKRALRKYCQCLLTDDWPSYDPAGLQFGAMQIIAPDGLWNYRHCAGMKELSTPEPMKPTDDERFDINN